MKKNSNYVIIIFFLFFSVTTLKAHTIYGQNYDMNCNGDRVAPALKGNALIGKVCGKFFVAIGLCKKISPFPSNKDIFDQCIGDSLSKGSHPHPHPPSTPKDKNFGEPHIITRDGLRYDFQAQGDYALIITDDIEVQARYTNIGRATIIRGVAVKVGATVVAIENSDDPSSVWINGVKANLSSGDWYDLDAPKGIVQRLGDGIIIRSEKKVNLLINKRYLEIQLNPQYGDKTQGLHGNGDGDPSNDLRTANGDPVDATNPESLYGQFMLDWRRDGKASLFPTPFQYIGDPNAISQEVVNLSDIDSTTRKNASEKCLAAGLKTGAGLDECTYDLAITGDDSFIDDALFVADSLKSTMSAAALTTQDISIFSLDSQASVLQGIPEKGAGELERSFNLDRYTLTVPESEDQYILIKSPCIPTSTIRILIRQDGSNIGEYSLQCNKLFKLPTGEVEIDVFSSVGDVFKYGFDIVDSSSKLVKRKTSVTITAPTEAIAGTEIEISWEAPKELAGRINSERANEKPNYGSAPYLHTKGAPSKWMRMPSAAGNYVLRWYSTNDREILAEHAITLTAADVSITAPTEAIAGTEIEISWEASKELAGRINSERANEKPNYGSAPYLHTEGASSKSMRMPSVAGDYVLRWYSTNDREILAEHAITLTAADVSITAPAEAIAGTEIEISWEAPKELAGRINSERANEKPNYNSAPYLHTEGASSKSMRMPSVAGNYVLRWYSTNDREILAEHAITLTAADVSITAPAEAIAGTEIEISWEAPKELAGRINSELANEKPNYGSAPYLHTKGASSKWMRMPSVAGDYMLRWYSTNDREILAEHAITLTAADVSITAPAQAIAGTEVTISWEAPKGLAGRINSQLANEKPSYDSTPYLHTKGVSSKSMRMPSVAGDYVLRWYSTNDREILAEHAITLTAADD